MNGQRAYRAPDGREWVVTLESSGERLRVAPDPVKGGALPPGREVRIVFTLGRVQISEEYTAMAPLEGMDEAELAGWFEAARRSHGL